MAVVKTGLRISLLLVLAVSRENVAGQNSLSTAPSGDSSIPELPSSTTPAVNPASSAVTQSPTSNSIRTVVVVHSAVSEVATVTPAIQPTATMSGGDVLTQSAITASSGNAFPDHSSSSVGKTSVSSDILQPSVTSSVDNQSPATSTVQDTPGITKTQLSSQPSSLLVDRDLNTSILATEKTTVPSLASPTLQQTTVDATSVLTMSSVSDMSDSNVSGHIVDQVSTTSSATRASPTATMSTTPVVVSSPSVSDQSVDHSATLSVSVAPAERVATSSLAPSSVDSSVSTVADIQPSVAVRPTASSRPVTSTMLVDGAATTLVVQSLSSTAASPNIVQQTTSDHHISSSIPQTSSPVQPTSLFVQQTSSIQQTSSFVLQTSSSLQPTSIQPTSTSVQPMSSPVQQSSSAVQMHSTTLTSIVVQTRSLPVEPAATSSMVTSSTSIAKPTPSATALDSVTPSATAQDSMTSSATALNSVTPIATAVESVTPSAVAMPSITPTSTVSHMTSAVIYNVLSPVPTPSVMPEPSPSSSPQPSHSVEPSRSSSQGPSATVYPETTPTPEPPAPVSRNISFEIEFKGVCDPLVQKKIILGLFWEELVITLARKLHVDNADIKPKDIACHPIRISFLILQTTNANISQELQRFVADGAFRFELPTSVVSGDSDSNYLYEAVSVKQVPLSYDISGTPDLYEVGLNKIDIIVIIVASCVSMVLICIGCCICLREYYVRRRSRSFDLSEIVNFNLKLEDYTLTKIARSKPFYTDSAVKMQSFTRKNGQQAKSLLAQEEKCNYDDVNEHNGVMKEVKVRMNSHSDGIVIGVTATDIPDVATNHRRPCPMDQSKEILFENQASPVHCMDNPIYYADDDRFTSV